MPMSSLPLLADFTSDEDSKKSKTPLIVSCLLDNILLFSVKGLLQYQISIVHSHMNLNKRSLSPETAEHSCCQRGETTEGPHAGNKRVKSSHC